MAAASTVAEEFQAHRERLLAIATRVLGNRADAEDVVQEAWVRLSRQPAGSVENLGGWLTTVVGRLSIDVLRSRTSKAEVSYETHLPDLVVTEDDDTIAATPEDQTIQGESIGLALLVVLGSLRPEERLAFVLHDVFAVPFAEIGPILDKSADAAKMIASRARRKVREARPVGGLREQRRVVDAFLAAARDGDFDALLDVLDPDLTWEIHGPRGAPVTRDRSDLVGTIQRGLGVPGFTARRVLVNGQPGILGWAPSGHPVALMACTVVRGRITRIASFTGRAALSRLDLPSPGGAPD